MRSHRWKATRPSSESIEGGSEDVPMLHGVTVGLGPITKHVVECRPSAYKHPVTRYSVLRQFPSLSSIQSVLAGSAYDLSDVVHAKENRRMRKADHGVVIEMYVRERAGRAECLGRQLE